MTKNDEKKIEAAQANLEKLKQKLSDLKVSQNVRRSIALIVKENWMRQMK